MEQAERAERAAIGAQGSGWSDRARGAGRWRAVLVQSVRDLRVLGAVELAAALAFYALLSLFPLLLVGAALASFVVEPAWAVMRVTDLLGQFVPRGAIEVEAIVDGAVAQRERAGLLSLVVLLASGRRVLGALTEALNRVSDVDPRADRVGRRILVELTLLAGLAGLVGLALSAGPLLRLLGGAARWPGAATVLRALLLLTAFFLIYTVVPRGRRDGRAALVGAAAATALVLVARWLFLLWVDRLWDSLHLIYGPLAVGTVLLLWAWYVALITLFGGALASHTKVMVGEGLSAEETTRRHVGQGPG